jgi:hypothetical protein
MTSFSREILLASVDVGRNSRTRWSSLFRKLYENLILALRPR